MKLRFFIAAAVLLLLSGFPASGQRSNILDQLRIGFGGGANTSHVIDLEPFTVFEDLSGATYLNRYSPVLSNIGNLYHMQLEWYTDFLVVALKPGTHTFRFSKENEVVFSGETADQSTPYLLRYFAIPAEVRYNLDLNRFRPYAGISASYSYLQGSNDPSTRSFIRHRFAGGAVAGTYIDLRAVILDLHLGYLAGVHNVANKSDRFGSGSGSTFAQNDLLLNHLQVSLSVLFSLQKQRRRGEIECYY